MIIGILLLFFILGCIFVIFDGTNIPEQIEKQRQYEKSQVNSACDGIDDYRDISCISEQSHTIDEDKKQCKKVLKNPSSYFREDVEKCKSMMKLN